MKIYIVFGEYGAYSDRTEWNICATRSKHKAAELVRECKEFDAFKEEFRKRLIAEFDEPYNVAPPQIPPRPMVSDEYHRLQTLLTSKFGTDQDREAYKKLQKEHNQALSAWGNENTAYNKKLNAWGEVKDAARNEWIKNNLRIPDNLREIAEHSNSDISIYESYNRTRYNYTEVELID